MQLRSCSMRSAVQVALEGTPFFGAGAAGAGSRAVDVIGGIAGDESGSDGAIDGDIETASLDCRGRLGRRQGVCPRAAGNRETKASKRKSVCGLWSRSGKRCPRRDPKLFQAGGSRSAEKVSPTKQLRRIHRAASRLEDGKPAVGVAPVRCTLSGPLLVAVEREPSPNRNVARFDSPAKG
jgi:hypothetical protein